MTLLTIREAADRLGCDTHDLAAVITEGKLPIVRRDGKTLIDEDIIVQIEQERQAGAEDAEQAQHQIREQLDRRQAARLEAEARNEEDERRRQLFNHIAEVQGTLQDDRFVVQFHTDKLAEAQERVRLGEQSLARALKEMEKVILKCQQLDAPQAPAAPPTGRKIIVDAGTS